MSTARHFSIVVPTRGRSTQLRACLDAIAQLNYPPDRFEVIVVADGVPAPPELEAAASERLDLKLLTQPHAGPAAARNTGAAQARGELLAFTDDDCAPSSDWLTRIERRFAAGSAQVVGGRTVNAVTANPYSTVSQLVVATLYGYYNSDPETARFLTTSNLALPARRFEALGGFDVSFPLAAGEDRDFSDRCLEAGFTMTYAPEVVVHHFHELSFASFWRQHFNYGRGASFFHRARARRGRGRVGVAPRFYAQLLRSALSGAPGSRRFVLAGLAVVTQMAYVAGFAWEVAGRRALGRLGTRSHSVR